MESLFVVSHLVDFIIFSLVIRYLNSKLKIPNQKKRRNNTKPRTKTPFIKMQSKLYVDMTLIKIILLECSVKENKASK